MGFDKLQGNPNFSIILQWEDVLEVITLSMSQLFRRKSQFTGSAIFRSLVGSVWCSRHSSQQYVAIVLGSMILPQLILQATVFLSFSVNLGAELVKPA
jgi:hypothetical protein